MMDTVDIKFGKAAQRKAGLLFLAIGVAGLAFAYYSWFIKTDGLIFGRVGSIGLTLLGFGIFLKTLLAPQNTDEVAIHFGPEGFSAKTSPIAKAIGLIPWEDVKEVYVAKNMLTLQLKEPEQYAGRIKSFLIRDTFIKAQQGAVPVSFLEVDVQEEEIRSLVARFFNP